MKLKNLFLALVTLLTFVGAGKAFAYSVDDLVSSGWTKVESISNVDQYYYVFVDGETSNYAMAHTYGNPRPVYNKLANPFGATNQVWQLEETSGTYYIKSYDEYYIYSGSAGWNNNLNKDNKSALTFTLADGKYKISDESLVGADGKYLGPWNGLGYLTTNWGQDKNEVEYQRVVVNKPENNTGHFYLYSMPKTEYDSKVRNEATLVKETWTKVTSVDGLGQSHLYYAFLDASEAGQTSGYVLTEAGADKRPIYTPLADPLETTSQLWITEAAGIGYAIKNDGDYQYLYCKANWNMSATTNQTLPNNSDFNFSVADGVWTLYNSISTNEFVGRWYNFADSPMMDEGLAANKSAGEGKRTFIIYSIPQVAKGALPLEGAMTADQWYYLDVAAAGDKYAATATDLGTITYTKDGKTMSTFTETNNTLGVGRYYIKSTSANSLEIAVKGDVYTLDEATRTTTFAEGQYIQSLTTFAVDYPNANTSTSAELGLIGTPVATLSKGGSQVTTGTLSASGTALTATFSSVTLDKNAQYTISIPAGVFGYEGQATNEAITMTVNTPAVLDGTYFLKSGNAYLSRGADSGTQAVADDFGIAVTIATDASNVSTIQFYDSKKYLFYSTNSSALYTDSDKSKPNYNWNITSDMKLYNVDQKMYAAVADGIVNLNADASAAAVWTLESGAEHKTAMANLKSAQIQEAAVAAGYAETTDAATLEGYFALSQTITIDSPTDVAELYQATGKVKDQTLTVNSGLYKLEVKAYARIASNDVAYAASTNNIDCPVAYIYANGVKTQLASVMDSYETSDYGAGSWWEDYNPVAGQYYPNGTPAAKKAFAEEGRYVNTLYIYVAEDNTSLNIGLANNSNAAAANWICYKEFTLTRYFNATLATDAEQQALEDAIAAAEAKTLGFDAGEYAPYNNVAALQTLATAQAIDFSVTPGTDVVAATEALASAEWVANETEVNAVYNGDFALCENNGDMPGWRMSNNTLGGDYHSRAFVGDNRLKEFNETGSGAFLRFDGTNSARGSMYFYGDTEGYVMPLNAETMYYVSVDFKGWGSTGKPLRLNVTGPDGFTSVYQEYNTTNNADTDDVAPQRFCIKFTTTTADNYRISFQVPGSDSNTHNVLVSNIELMTVKPVTVTMNVSSANKYGTFIAPFDVTIPSGVTASKITGVSDADNSVLLFENLSGTIPANTPVVLYSASGVNQNFTDLDLSTADTYKNGLLVGTHKSMPAPEGSYVLQNNDGRVAFYLVNETIPTVGANRCYLERPAISNEVKAFWFDEEDATTIESVEALTSGQVEAIYTINGVKVDSLQRGMNIVKLVNGKVQKIYVK